MTLFIYLGRRYWLRPTLLPATTTAPTPYKAGESHDTVYLPRTAILAAANPIGGHYNRAKTVSENLKLGPALLSRFDLVFILIDRPDLLQDSLLSDHVMALHTTSAAGGIRIEDGKGNREEGT